MSYTNNETKDLILRAKGGKRMYHVYDCDFLSNMDMNLDGFDFENFKYSAKTKTRLCPTCGNLVLVAPRATSTKNYEKNRKKYKQFFGNVDQSLLVSLFVNAHARVTIDNDVINIQCRDDDWKINMAFGECELYHNNYPISDREKDGSKASKGFHQERLYQTTQSARFREALAYIAKYKFDKATEVHKKKRAVTPKRSINDLVHDRDMKSDPYCDPAYYGF